MELATLFAEFSEWAPEHLRREFLVGQCKRMCRWATAHVSGTAFEFADGTVLEVRRFLSSRRSSQDCFPSWVDYMASPGCGKRFAEIAGGEVSEVDGHGLYEEPSAS
jgi:hypothetical protein